MITRTVKETVREYDKNGKVTRKSITEVDEIDDGEEEGWYVDDSFFVCDECLEGFSSLGDIDTIKIAKLNDKAAIPTKREGDGCYDLYACFDENYLAIEPFSVKLIPTGLCSSFSDRYRISIRERGSNTKSNIKVSAGQIDSSYRGEWFVALYNANKVDVVISKESNKVKCFGDRIVVPYSKAIAQFAVEEVPLVVIREVSADEIQADKSERGDGKLGSSGA